MLKTKYFKIVVVFLILLIAVQHNAFAQKKATGKFRKAWMYNMQKLAKTPWVFGLGWNIVDDNGNPFKKLFDAGNSWNIQGYPSTLRVEKFYDYGVSFLFAGAFNQYGPNKIINSELTTEKSIFMSYDLGARFNFSYLYDINSKWFKFKTLVFDPYATSSFGYTYRDTRKVQGAATYNLGFGLHSWIYKGFGVNLEAVAKLGLTSPFFKTPANYKQINFGVIYKFIPPGGSASSERKILKGI